MKTAKAMIEPEELVGPEWAKISMAPRTFHQASRAGKSRLIMLAACLSLVAAQALRAQSEEAAKADSGAWAPPQAVRDIQKTKNSQFIAFNPNYAREKTDFVARLRESGKKLFAREAAGEKVGCAPLIFKELLWRVSYSADVKLMDERLHDMDLSLEDAPTGAAEKTAGPECLVEWWEQMDWAYEHMKDQEPVPPAVLDRFNTPEKLTALLTSLSVSDIAKTGRDNAWEFNVCCADLIRWILGERPTATAFSPELKTALLDALTRLQDPETGYWGERYLIASKEQFVPDLSTTFHIVSYLKGDVPHIDQIVSTTLAVKDLDAPYGWMYNGQPWNHMYMDVAELFKWGWPHASEGQKKAMAAGIQDMLHRCLTESLQADGSFKRLEVDTSLEECMYWGVEFLSRVGYFDKSKRFWTDQTFPEAEGVRLKIKAFIERQAGGTAGGGWYHDAMKILSNAKTDAPP